jgi:hypothetical protein
LSFINLDFGPFKELVGQIVNASDIIAFFFVVTECIGSLDLVWLPFVFSWFVFVVFGILVRFGVLDFALDWTDRPDVGVTIRTLKVTSVFLLDWTLVGSALWLHVFDFVELATEVIARDILVKLHVKTLDGTCQGSN